VRLVRLAVARPGAAPRALPLAVWLAEDAADMARGLGGAPVDPRVAMLFAFAAPARHAFHTRTMRGRLDFAFLRSDARGYDVLQVRDRVAPGELDVRGRAPYDAVLELPGGAAALAGVAAGARIVVAG